MNQAHFDTLLKIRYLLQRQPTDPLPSIDQGGVKLPQSGIPTFDGNIVNWRSFWKQYNMSVHRERQLKNAEKLAYLRYVLKDGSAKHVVEGLSGSGEYYQEAIECLQVL